MNEFLEKLEIGENKVKLSKEEIKSIMAEHGKTVKTETEKVETKYKEEISSKDKTIADLKAQMDKTPKSEDVEKLKQTIADYEKADTERKEAEKKAKKDEVLLQNINEAIGDKKFVNDYTKNSIVNEIKSALENEANAGKSAKDLFESLTKDKQGIFESSNQFKDMPGTGDVNNPSNVKTEGIKLNPMFKKF